MLVSSLFVLLTIANSIQAFPNHCSLPGLYFTNLSSILCFPINASSGLPNNEHPHILANSTGFIRTIEVDEVNQHIYWGDLFYNNIHRSALNGTNSKLLFSYGIGVVQGIAVDWSSDIVYWTDSLMKLIELADTNGSYRKVLFKLENGDEPRGIAVDPKKGYLFWTDWGAEPRIERSSLSGSNRKTIVSSKIKWPNDLAIDGVSGRIFWIDAYLDVIESVSFDGEMRQVVFTMNYERPHPYSITYSHSLNATYWTDWLSNSIYVASNSLQFSDKSKLLYVNYQDEERYKTIGQIRFLEDQLYSASKPCLSSQNNCSHLCLKESEDHHVCACPTGMSLVRPENKTCENVERNFEMYFADSYAKSVNHLIKYIDDDGFTIKPLPIPFNLSLEFPVALDYDPYEKYIYWTDHLNNKTYRMHEDGTNFSVVLHSKEKASLGIAVDKVNRVMYWFGGGNKLMMSSLDGKYVKTVYEFGYMRRLRDIAIYEEYGLIFFTSFNCIGRIFVNGTGLRCLMKRRKSYPNGLAIDKIEKRIYWCEQYYHSISSCDLDLRNVRLVIQKTVYFQFIFWIRINTGYVVEPYSVSVLGEKIYWTDTHKRAIFRADKRGGSNIEYITSGLDHPRDLHVYSDKNTTEYRKVYKFSFASMRRGRVRYARCHSTAQCNSNTGIPEPDQCPSGYRETNIGSTCANCSDPFGGNFKCFCDNWKTCGQRAYAEIKGCHPRNPFMFFKVRECIQAVKPGVCSFKMLTSCPLNATQCLSDDDCTAEEKCCQTNCGLRCTQPVEREDSPCTVNNGGCSHFCVKTISNYQCMCPDGMVVDVDGKSCIYKNETIGGEPCLLPKHIGSCHPINSSLRWYYNSTSRQCERFKWGGCDNNGNNFVDQTECNAVCRDNPCLSDKGGCSHSCKFHGNGLYQCFCPQDMVIDTDGKTCVINNATQIDDICALPKHPGSCHSKSTFTSWYFDDQSKNCKSFQYSGCDGNKNIFDTIERCEHKCTGSCHMWQNDMPCSQREDKCSNDSQCIGKKLCCSVPCGRKCSKPISRVIYPTFRHSTVRSESIITPSSTTADYLSSELTYVTTSSFTSSSIRSSGFSSKPVEEYTTSSLNMRPSPSAADISVFTLMRVATSASVVRPSPSTLEASPSSTDVLHPLLVSLSPTASQFDIATVAGKSFVTVPKPLPKCFQPLIYTSCEHTNTSWYFDSHSKKCKMISENQCIENENKFTNKLECYKQCSYVICREQIKVGVCSKKEVRWYYNKTLERCESFSWGRCKMNSNDFASMEECNFVCNYTDHLDPCNSLECQNGGSCVYIGKYGSSAQCKCTGDFVGKTCTLNIESGKATVQFKRERAFSEITEDDIRLEFAKWFSSYCSTDGIECDFKEVDKRKRKRRSEESEFKFQSQDILILDYDDNNGIITVTFVVLQPADGENASNGFLTKKSVKGGFNSFNGNIGRSIGVRFIRWVKRMPKKRWRRTSSILGKILPAFFPCLVLLLAALFWCYRKRKISAATQSNRSRNEASENNQVHCSFENQLYDDLYAPKVSLPPMTPPVEREDRIQSFANPSYDVPVDDDLIGAVGNREESETQKKPISDWVQFTNTGEVINGPTFNELNNPDHYNVEMLLDEPPPEYTSRAPTPIHREPFDGTHSADIGYNNPPQYVDVVPQDGGAGSTLENDTDQHPREQTVKASVQSKDIVPVETVTDSSEI